MLDKNVILSGENIMKTEKEIRDKLEVALKQLDSVKAEYNKYIGTIYESRYIPDICDDCTAIESKVRTLEWVLGI